MIGRNNIIKRLISASGVLLLPLLSLAVWSEGEQQFAELEQCELENGQVIRPCSIAYRRYGSLNPDGNNIIVFPTWFTGTSGELIDYKFIGPGKLADTDRYHVIAIDALANGISSSPSNWPATGNDSFPEITISDMVKAQYVLLNSVLNISHVHAVVGISMGGMQTFQWISQYPEFMNYAVAVDGTPSITSYGLLLMQTRRDIIETMQEHNIEMRKIMDLVTMVGMLGSWTPDYFVENIPPKDIEKFIHEKQKSNSGFHADDFVAQIDAMMKHDIYAANGKSQMELANLIKAKLLVIAASTDHMVNANPPIKLADALGAEKLVLDSNCGHWATTSCDQALVARTVQKFLNKE